MRGGGYLFGLTLAVSAGAAIEACGSNGATGDTASSMSTAASMGATSGHGGSGSGTGGMGEGGGFFDAGPKNDASSMQDGDACGSVALKTQVTPGNIVVVFDQSNSMDGNFKAGDAGASGVKWQVAENAIVNAVSPIQNLLNLGSIFFPTANCAVNAIDMGKQIKIEPGMMFVTDFQAYFADPAWKTIGSTPIKIALDQANAALPDPSPLVGQRAVVVITDGAPTCTTNQAAILMPVQAMFSRGIKTYAVGLPGSQTAATLLDAIANAGGTGNYLSPGDPQALQDALAMIASNTVDQCTISLDPPPLDPTQVHLIVTDAADPDGKEILQGMGWTLSPDGKTATLDGMVCQTAKNGGYTSINFVYGCPKLPG